jgi:hypothetical protein
MRRVRPEKPLTGIDRRAGVLELQGALATHAEARGPEILARGLLGTLGVERLVDHLGEPLVESGLMIEVEHHRSPPDELG